MRASYQAGLLRQAFEQQRDAVTALMQTIDEQLKRAAGVLVDHARTMAAAIKGAPVAESEAPDPPELPALAPSARGPSLEVLIMYCSPRRLWADGGPSAIAMQMARMRKHRPFPDGSAKGQVDPELPSLIGLMNGRDAPESGRCLTHNENQRHQVYRSPTSPVKPLRRTLPGATAN